MKYFLSSFGLNNQFISIDLADHLVYPISLNYQEGLDLDYGMLLVADKFSIAKDTYDFVLNDTRKLLNPMKYSLKKLEDSGKLELISSKEIIAEFVIPLMEKTNRISENLDAWLPLIRKQWRYLKPKRKIYVDKYATASKKALTSNHFTLTNALFRLNGKIEQKEIDHYDNILLSKRKRLSKDEERVMVETVKPLICHLLMQDLLSVKSSSILLDWADSEHYYEQLYLSRWENVQEDSKIAKKSKEIFQLTIPQTRSGMVDDLIKYMEDEKAVTSFRKQLKLMVDNEIEPDEKWLNSYQSLIISSNTKHQKNMKKVRFWSTVAGLFVPGASLVSDVLAEGASSVIEDLTDKAIATKDHKWYFAFQENFSK